MHQLHYQIFLGQLPHPELSAPGEQLTLRLLEKDYTGTPVELRGGVPAFEIEWVDTSDDPYTPVLAQKATINLIASPALDVSDLHSPDPDFIRVEILDSLGEVIWFGRLTSVDAKEPYQAKPYPVTLTAIDGLADLKNKALSDALGVRLKGIQNLSDIVGLALLQVTDLDHERPISYISNLYEITQAQAGTYLLYDPLKTARLHSERLVNEDGTAISAGDAVSWVATAFAARVTQALGRWWFARVDELIGGYNPTPGSSLTSVLVRHYPNLATGTPTLSTVELAVQVGRTRAVRVLSGGITRLQPEIGSVRVNQDFGPHRNRLRNGSFADMSGDLPEYWARHDGLTASECYRVGAGTKDDPYRLRINGDTDTSDVYFLTPHKHVESEAYVETTPKGQANTYRIKGKFKLNQASRAKLLIWAEYDPSEGWPVVLLRADGSWKKSPSKKDYYSIDIDHFIELGENNYATKSSYGTIDIETQPLMGNYKLYVRLYQPLYINLTSHPSAWVEWEHLTIQRKREGTGLRDDLNGMVTIREVNTDVPADEEQTLHIGDIPPAASPSERTGALFYNGMAPTTSWYGPYDEFGPLKPRKPLRERVADSRLKAQAKPMQVFEGTLVGKLPFGPLSVLYFDDIFIKGTSTPAPFRLVQWKWNPILQQHSVTAVEVNTVVVPSIKKTYWDTPDGLIAVEENKDTGEVLSGLTTLKPNPLLLKNLDLGTPTLGANFRPSGFTGLNVTAPVILGANFRIDGENLAIIYASLIKISTIKSAAGL